ncbi:protein kinase [Achlya hypogyna]|uniref:Protein kinase n=1 Tax=Achlya hypogyna TaxID=1202772 RepID=A0A1V9ZUT4_ACHHY|nr:protein kinase [Achlya hypogyna]
MEVNFSLGFKSPCFFTMLNLAGYQIPLLERNVVEWCERIVAVLNKERTEGNLDDIVHEQTGRPLFLVKMVSSFANDGTASPRIMLGTEQGSSVYLHHEIAIALITAIMEAEEPLSKADLATTKKHIALLKKRIAKEQHGQDVYAMVMDRFKRRRRGHPRVHDPVRTLVRGSSAVRCHRRQAKASRWFVLDGARHALLKYDSEKRTRLRGASIDVTEARVEATDACTLTLHLRVPYHGQHVVRLTAPTPVDRDRWADALAKSAQGLASGISKRMCHRGVLNGQYVLVRELGRGASGVVYLYTCRGKPCAVKRLSASKPQSKVNRRGVAASSGGLSDDIKREIALLKKVSNLPHVVALFDVIHDADADCVYLVMEFLGGGPVAVYDKETRRFHTKAPMGESDFKRLMRCATVGLKYLHANHLVHRDIKPDNLLLTEDASECKLADLGVAHYFTPPTSVARDDGVEVDAEGAAPGTLRNTKGTYEFMSPEALSGDEYSGYAADIWALGVTLYALVCGSLPFEAPNILALFDTIATAPLVFPTSNGMSPELKDLLSRMLTKEASERITLDGVLQHPWLSTGATKSFLHHSTSPLLAVVLNAAEVTSAVSPLQLKFDRLCESSTTTEDLALWTLTPSFVPDAHTPYVPSPISIADVAVPPTLQQDVRYIAQQVHFAWCTQKTLDGWRYGAVRDDESKVHPLLVPYQHLDAEGQARNVASVTASLQCILALGYSLRPRKMAARCGVRFPMSLERTSLSGELIILGDLLAENDHEVWAQEYMQHGWTYDQVYDLEKKTHPALVPYPALAESHRVSNRNAALVVIKSLVVLHYTIQHEHAKYNTPSHVRSLFEHFVEYWNHEVLVKYGDGDALEDAGLEAHAHANALGLFAVVVFDGLVVRDACVDRDARFYFCPCVGKKLEHRRKRRPLHRVGMPTRLHERVEDLGNVHAEWWAKVLVHNHVGQVDRVLVQVRLLEAKELPG